MLTLGSLRARMLRSRGFLGEGWGRGLATACNGSAVTDGGTGLGTRSGDPSARSAYVHLPFCKRKCFYCDFPVVALGKAASAESPPPAYENYVNLLSREVRSYASQAEGAPLETVFFGGGTPSLIPPPQLERILTCLDSVFGLAPNAEISMECDPGTFDQRKLQEFADLGVNRVSLGVQSFDSKLLEACGRSHTLAEVYKAIEDVHGVTGLRSWSLDLMHGLPHQTPEVWEATLEETLRAMPPHVSCYDLQVEENTPFDRWYQVGNKPLPDEDEGALLFAMASDRLGGSGYDHYEICSFAKGSEHRCVHNLGYWRNDAFYGFGLGATSKVHGRRLARPRKMKAYEDWVERGAEEGEGSHGEIQGQEKEEEDLLDSIMLSLRLSSGLDLLSLDAEIASKVVAAVKDHAKEGLVVLDDKSLRLKDPEGYLLSNTIISDIFAALDAY